MLATFSSFLPSGLSFSSADKDKEKQNHSRHNLSNNNSENNVNQDQDATYDDGRVKEKDMFTNDEGVTKRKKEKHINETLIVVRPPPAVSNHPLNLQLQLVPPSQRDPIRPSRPSIDFTSSDSSQQQTTTEDGHVLTRTLSTRSNRSDVSASIYSSISSIQSVSSFASGFSTSTTSTTSSSGGRRTIIPLYNLQAHNVMTNTICDAGTDAKVVKFHKRGMEVLGFAILEPVEVWSSFAHSSSAAHHQTQSDDASKNLSLRITPTPSSVQQQQQTTPTSSVNSLSVSSAMGHATTPISSRPQNYPYIHGPGSPSTPAPLKGRRQALSVGAEPIPSNPNLNGTGGQQQQQQPGSPAKKIFGKLFKRRENTTSGGGTPMPSPEFNDYASMSEGKGTLSGHSRSLSHPANYLSPSSEKNAALTVLPTIFSSSSSTAMPNKNNVDNDTESVSGGKVRARNQGHVRTHSRVSESGHPSVNVSPPSDELQYQQQQVILPPVLGIQPLFVSATGNMTSAAVGRPTRYVWFLQKWIKSPGVPTASNNGEVEGGGGGGGGSKFRAFLSGGGEKSKHSGGYDDSENERGRFVGRGGGEYVGEAEVRIEWIRAQKVKKRRSVVMSASGGNTSGTSLSNPSGSGNVERRNSVLARKGSVKNNSATAESQDSSNQRNGSLRSNADSLSRRKRMSSSQRESTGTVMTTNTNSSGTTNDSTEDVNDQGQGHSKTGSWGRKRKGGSNNNNNNDPYGSAKGKEQCSGSRVQIVVPDEHQQQQEGGEVDDAGEESDPEDSETPWSCVLTLTPRASATSTSMSSLGSVGGAGAGAGKGLGLLNVMNLNAGHGTTGVRPISIASFDSELQHQLLQRGQGQGQAQAQAQTQFSPDTLSSPSARSSTTSSSKTPTLPSHNNSPSQHDPKSPHAQKHTHAHPIRLKIATLSPAPHHPKVVAQLKVAFPLPDIDIDTMRVRKRVITPAGQLVKQPVEVGYRGVTMTAEELKDLLCSTALWLVVREGFGGVGNVRRKGDGWRIRG